MQSVILQNVDLVLYKVDFLMDRRRIQCRTQPLKLQLPPDLEQPLKKKTRCHF